MKWLYPLKDVNSMFSVLDGTTGRGELNIRDNNWHNVKWNLPYLVYQIDINYEESIKKIDSLLMEYKKIHSQFMSKLSALITNVVYPSGGSGIICLYSRNPDKLIAYTCSEKLMEELLTDLKENNGKIECWIRDVSGGAQTTKSFDYKGFILKVDEIKEKIRSDTEMS